MDKDPAIYDRQLSLELAGGNEALASQMFEMLLKELPELQTTMNNAFAEQDGGALYDSVHKINGSTRYCGVPAVGAAAHELETLLKKEADELDDALGKLNTEIDRLLDYKA